MYLLTHTNETKKYTLNNENKSYSAINNLCAESVH